MVLFQKWFRGERLLNI